MKLHLMINITIQSIVLSQIEKSESLYHTKEQDFQIPGFIIYKWYYFKNLIFKVRLNHQMVLVIQLQSKFWRSFYEKYNSNFSGSKK
ncbi:hypothetical protein CG710_002015 [Lachnotalea glycerini]|uniref:Uncharacterized protein n=1 Tax=Lachnotalea glycerini TaxID=1763509 RepID=A0A371JJ23_9FIRM|nr:hypothetical protein CG710_002015 [Lachnotalea glycerini]